MGVIFNIEEALHNSAFNILQEYLTLWNYQKKIQMNIKNSFLFGEIKDLTSSEERSRTIITGYKARYRTLYEKFIEKCKNHKNLCEFQLKEIEDGIIFAKKG